MPPSPKTSTDRRTLEVRIYSVYASLSPAEKKLADILIQHQTDLPSYTSGELAAEAGVSKATAARLVQALGYQSYSDAKRQVRSLKHWGSPRAGLADPSAPPSGNPTLAEMVEADIDNIRTTSASVSPQTLAAVASAIADARQLWIAGLRSGYGLAQHAAHYFSLVSPGVQIIQNAAISQSHAIASIRPGDVMLVVAFRRRPRLLPALLEAASAAGATTVLITDLSAGASAKAADHVLRCKSLSPSPFSSFAAAVTLINYLAWSAATLVGEECLARFERIDELVEKLDDVSAGRGD